LLKSFDRFRKAVGRGAAALRVSTHARDPVPLPSSAPSALAGGRDAPGESAGEEGAADGAGDRARALVAANELLRSSREAQALELAQIWIQRDPEDLDFRRVAGDAQKALRWLKEAAENLELVRAARGDDVAILRALGEIYDGLGRNADAIACWESVVKLSGAQDLSAMTALGIDLSRAGEHARAVEILEAIVHSRPDSSAAFADLGMALLEAGRINEAVGAFSSARSLDPSSAQAHCGLGLAYQGLERWHEATDAFAETERLAPESAVGPYNLGLALGKLGDTKGMRHALLRAASLEPDDDEIHAALERVFLAPRAPERAEAERTPDPETARAASMSGSLKTFQLLDLLEFLRIQSQTGTLFISSPLGVGSIVLSQGSLMSVATSGRKPLADELVDRGLVARASVEEATKAGPPGPSAADDELGEALCRDGLLSREQLQQVLLDRAIDDVERLNGWTDGTFHFHPSESPGGVPIASKFDLRRLVLEMQRRAEARPVAVPR
jgi:tetratricopeptide (TPR) repeat protein